MVAVSGVLLQDDQGRILLAQRQANKSIPFLWEIPGEKPETGEIAEDALVLELEKEIGVLVSYESLTPFTFITHRYPNFQILLLVYKCLQWKGSPQALKGQAGIEGVTLNTLHNYPTTEANWVLIPLLQRGPKS